MKRFWMRLGGPVKIGLVVGAIGALLTVIGLLTGNWAPLTLRSLLLGILLGGGSWGVVSWAIAEATTDAAAETGAEAGGDAGPEDGAPAGPEGKASA